MRTRSTVRWWVRGIAAAGAVVLVVGVAAAAVGFGAGGTGTSTTADRPPDTAKVTRQTMVDTDAVPGDLGYGATTTLAGRIAGVITSVPLAGDVIGRAQPIYRVDNRPVVLMYGDVAAYRTLRLGIVGADVRQLADNLKALGYGGFAPDDTYTAATATAVKRWQRGLGLPQTDQVELGRVLFALGQIRVDTVTAGVNQSTGDGQEVLRYTGTGRQVTARLEVSQQRLARKGVEVQVQMPDGKQVAGRVDRVYTVIEQPTDSGSQAVTSIETIVSLSDPTAAAGIEAAVVTVVFTADERGDVLTVPIAALVALAEGGYGVEVVEGTTTHPPWRLGFSPIGRRPDRVRRCAPQPQTARSRHGSGGAGVRPRAATRLPARWPAAPARAGRRTRRTPRRSAVCRLRERRVVVSDASGSRSSKPGTNRQSAPALA